MSLKKIIAVTAAFVLAAGVFTAIPAENPDLGGISITASAASDFTIEKDEDGRKMVTAYKGKGGDITIPEEADGVAEDVFKGNSKITSVTFPANCTDVYHDAFAYCANLEKVVFEGDALIAFKAFQVCPSLKSVTIKGGVMMIGGSAFFDCSSLETVKIYKNRYDFNIENLAFANCYSLNYINIPNKCFMIQSWAFVNCFSLTKLTIPQNTYVSNNLGTGMYMKDNDLDNLKAADGKAKVAVDVNYSKDKISGNSGDYKDYKYNPAAGDVKINTNIVYKRETFTPKAITLTVTKGSDAEKYAKKNGVKYKYAGDTSGSQSDGKLAAPTGFKASASQTKLTLKWDEVKGADGYRVYMYNSKTGKYEKYQDVIGEECLISGLTKGTKYSFKAAALVKTNGKYTVQTASKAVSVTTKK